MNLVKKGIGIEKNVYLCTVNQPNLFDGLRGGITATISPLSE